MILESIDEIKAQGVTVYPHVTAPAKTPPAPAAITHAVAILAGASTDELATFARLFMAANAVNADIAINALCDVSLNEPMTANAVDSIVSAIMSATDDQRVDIATALAQRHSRMADALATAIHDAVWDAEERRTDVDYDTLPAVMQ